MRNSIILLYGDVSLNIVDGSSVWLTSMSEVMSRVADHVHVLSKVQLTSTVLSSRITQLPNVTLHPPQAGLPITVDGVTPVSLNGAGAAQRLDELARELDPGAVIVRGFEVCHELTSHASLQNRLWAYVTDLPYPINNVSATGAARLNRIARFAEVMFAQTDSARSYLEAIAPESCGKVALMTPMIDDLAFSLRRLSTLQSDRLRIVYSGKLARHWKTLELLELPAALAREGVASELWVIGDKFQKDNEDRTWHVRMREALQAASKDPQTNVTWFGGVQRAEALRLVSESDLGIGWRTDALDGSIEISTKMLEYCACGVPSIINRTEDHIATFGADYPLYTTGKSDVDELARLISRTSATLPSLSQSVAHIADGYSFSQTVERMDKLFRRLVLTPGIGEVRPVHLAVASHDLKFIGELLTAFEKTSGLTLRLDKWQTLHHNDETHSLDTVNWAETIFCEWAGPNLVWYAAHKKPSQRLIARLHGFELRGQWLENLDVNKVDTFVTVSDCYRAKVLDRFNLPPDRVVTIPNIVDTVDLDRPKVKEAQFRLGLVGWVGFNKRPDRALDILEHLLEIDDRYFLHFKGRMPWEYPYEWDQPLQRQLYAEFFARISQNNLLANHVVFEPFSADIASWLRRIGYILSPSDYESFHLAPAEGMASHAVPIIWEREGAREVFSDRWIVPNADSAAERILTLQEQDQWEKEGAAAHQYSKRWDPSEVLKAWKVTLLQS